ncbi:uncharacterized protein LOC108624879 [Ceratina calcarata]|uniref:Uncharacterized protein LOC108624879 n=1 Tax=Ceratina calcarata TaxID=156304 RepID=A0AAJ7IYW4_9HYME|nr:uncharacterized protein LOC108624879 [Ceratina calcarata]
MFMVYSRSSFILLFLILRLLDRRDRSLLFCIAQKIVRYSFVTMSWWFGKKKQQKDSTEEEQPSEPNNGFVHVYHPGPVPPNVSQTPTGYPTGNLYPHVPPVDEFGQPVFPDSSKNFNQGDNVHYLHGVPFKLCKQLENSLNDDFEIEKLKISEIVSLLQRIEDENYDYTFSLEDSVVAEMNCTND